MKRKKKKSKFYEVTDKRTLFTFVFLRILIIICLIREIMNGNIENALLCVLSLFLFTIPYTIEHTFKITFPGALERTVYIFIFSAEILGEINNFYGYIPFWDTILHTVTGFLCASLGFSLVYLLNENASSFKLSPIFVSIVAFCFSMTIGVFWEVFEYGVDVYFKSDMQKDEYVETIKTVTLDPLNDNNVITIKDIDHTILYDSNNKELVTLEGYLDVGLNDTMQDLIVNFIGALVFSIFGYLYLINENKYKLAGSLITRRTSET